MNAQNPVKAEYYHWNAISVCSVFIKKKKNSKYYFQRIVLMVYFFFKFKIRVV